MPWGNPAMPEKTIARANLVDTLSEEIGLSRRVCSALLDDVLAEVAACLNAGDPVKIANFGTLTVRRRSQRVGRNFQTGEPVAVEARRVVVLRPARKLRHYSNHPEDIPKRPKRQLELF